MPSSEPTGSKGPATSISQAVPVVVSGMDVLDNFFRERTTTTEISCQGCRYRSRHFTPKGTAVTLEIPGAEPGEPPRAIRARVLENQRIESRGYPFEVVVELETPGNVWGVSFPPEDWGSSSPRDSQASGVRVPSTTANPQEEVFSGPSIASLRGKLHTELSVVESGSSSPKLATPTKDESEQQLRLSVREAAAEAVARESEELLAGIRSEIHAATEKAAQTAAAAAVAQEVRQALNRIEQAASAVAEAGREQWNRLLAADLKEFREQLAARLAEESAKNFEESVRGLQAESHRLSRQVAGSEEHLDGLGERLKETTAKEAKSLQVELQAYCARLKQETEAALAQVPGNFRAKLETEASEISARLLPKIEEQVVSQLQPVNEALQKASSQQQDALEALTAQREQLSEQLRELPSLAQKEIEEQTRTTLRNCLSELDARSTDTLHTAFDSLLKAAEWHQKKALSGMQAGLEKVLEEATKGMAARAANVSRAFASELDRFSLQYVEHIDELVKDKAKEYLETVRKDIEQQAESAVLSFKGSLRRAAEEHLQSIQEADQVARGEAHAQLQAISERSYSELRAGAEKTLAECSQELATYQADALNENRRELQAQQASALQELRAQREADNQSWRANLEHVGQGWIEHCKQRLENTGNSWLVASVAMLDQRGQAVLDKLGRSAEQVVRQAVASALTGLAQSLNAREPSQTAEREISPSKPEKT